MEPKDRLFGEIPEDAGNEYAAWRAERQAMTPGRRAQVDRSRFYLQFFGVPREEVDRVMLCGVTLGLS
jgi:hypothetical protein